MKQTFTLLTAFACSILSAFSQTTSQNFDAITSTAPLANNCWSFTSVNLEAAGNGTIGRSNNLIFTLGNGSFSTPYISLVKDQSISFDYLLTSKLTGSNATRTITVSLVSYDMSSTLLRTITLDGNTNEKTVIPVSITVPSTSVQKIVFTMTAGNNSSDFVLIDNINFGGSINNSGQYACAAAITLPIKLRSFQGLVAADKVQLSWSVSDNETGSHFEVERSLDGKEFKTIAVVNTTGVAGDASYAYNDGAQTAAYYRLKIVNNTKSFTYSNILFIKNTGVASNSNALNLLQNPVLSTLKFSFVSDAAASTEVVVYNMSGVKVYQTSFKALKGNNQIATILDGSIQSGTYVLEVKNNTNRSTAKFVKN